MGQKQIGPTTTTCVLEIVIACAYIEGAILMCAFGCDEFGFRLFYMRCKIAADLPIFKRLFGLCQGRKDWPRSNSQVLVELDMIAENEKRN